MSTVLSCQELSFVGGPGYNGPYSGLPSADPTVDVSTETLLSLWDAGARDTALCQPHETPLRELQYDGHGGPQQHTWPELLSPHLQRNKQLQDTLLQREEELARLHEENNKLREFLSSSYVRSLEERHKKLLNAPSRHRKRRGQPGVDRRGSTGLDQVGVSKRTCRNLSLEFCSAEELEATPPVESWVLETLGLKDQDTIDPQASFSIDLQTSFTIGRHASFSSPTSLLANHPTPPDYNVISDRPTIATATAITASPHYQSPRTATQPHYPSPTTPHYASAPSPAYSPALASTCDLSAIMASPSSSYEASANSFCSSRGADMTPTYPSTLGGPLLSPSPSPCPSERLAPVAASTPQRCSQLQLFSTVSSSPFCGSGEQCSNRVALNSHPVGVVGEQCSPVRSRCELAFSMRLSPHSSVRTHSFPQGQAFVRKDTQGGWNFTWVPKQCS